MFHDGKVPVSVRMGQDAFNPGEALHRLCSKRNQGHSGPFARFDACKGRDRRSYTNVPEILDFQVAALEHRESVAAVGHVVASLQRGYVPADRAKGRISLLGLAWREGRPEQRSDFPFCAEAEAFPLLSPRKPRAIKNWDAPSDILQLHSFYYLFKPSILGRIPLGHGRMTTDRTDIHGFADRLSVLIRKIRGFRFLKFGCGRCRSG
jgi:hypothetical protein